MKKTVLIKSLFALGLLFSILPPAVASLCYFPLWRAVGADVAISGLAAILLTVSFIPLIKLLKNKLKSPASWVIWLITFLVFFILSKVADQMVVISFAGLIGNLLGLALFRLSGKLEKRKD